MSPPEVIFWNAVKGRRLGFEVNRQKPLGPYFLDFYIAQLKLAIEIDGKIHEATYEHDERRDRWLESQGLTIIRIPARAIFENIGDVVAYIQHRVDEIAAEKGI